MFDVKLFTQLFQALRQETKTVPKRDDRITADDDLEVDVCIILIDGRLGDIEPVVFQQTFFEEEHSIIRTAVVSVKCVTIKSLTIFVDGSPSTA
jgi:CTP synthase (UTP-ammonia lyase)